MAANSRFAVATHVLVALAHLSRHAPPALRREDGRVSSETIASSVNTNPVVVRRVVASLVRGGLVESHQGKGGGLELARPPERITLRDVYDAMGAEPVFAFNPAPPNPKCPVSARMADVLAPVMAAAQEAVRERLRKITLASLLRQI